MGKIKTTIVALGIIIFLSNSLNSYPIDGYSLTGIKRLLRIQKIMSGEIKDTKPISGALKLLKEINLNLLGKRGDSLDVLPQVDNQLQKEINSLFPNLDESYAISILDITKGKKLRYAQRQENRDFMPGSVGKLAILVGLFSELERLYPDSFEKRQALLKNTTVRAGIWAIENIHTVPFYNPENNVFLNALYKLKMCFHYTNGLTI